MSYDFIVYAKGKKIPGPHVLVRQLQAMSPCVSMPHVPSFHESEGFIQAFVGEQESGFELFVSEISDKRRQRFQSRLAASDDKADRQHLDILMSSDLNISLSCQDGLSIIVGRTIAKALAIVSDGHFSDPQTDETFSAEELRVMAKE